MSTTKKKEGSNDKPSVVTDEWEHGFSSVYLNVL